jgi:predicted RNase H-like HicB family nuclease
VTLALSVEIMRTLTALLHRGDPDEDGFWATCLEVPGANGQGETREECLQNLSEAVKLILDLNEEDAFRDDPCAEKTSLALA